MIRFSMFVLSGALIVPGGAALAADAGISTCTQAITVPDDERIEHGVIKSVDLENDQFVIQSDERGEEVTIRVNERTQYTLDGEEARKEQALREGNIAHVRMQDETALQVDATSGNNAPAETATDDEQTQSGEIQRVDRERNRFVIKSEDGEEVTVRVNEQTQYSLDGEESSMEEALREGHIVHVRMKDEVAVQVDASTPAL